MTEEELERFDLAEADIDQLLKQYTSEALAAYIMENFSVSKEVLKFKSSRPRHKFEIKLAVLSVERYKSLLRIEQEL